MLSDICYKKNYLKEVIARVDFLSPVEGIETQLPRDLRAKAMRFFPIPEPKEIIARSIAASFGSSQPDNVQSTRTSYVQWNFHGKDRSKTLTIEPRAVYVVYNSYQSFENVAEEFLGFTSEFFAVYENVQVRRLGLRYVNEIQFDEGDLFSWDEYLNEHMLCLLRFYPESETIARAFQILELNFDEFNVRFRFGMYNPDFPARIKRKIFALDLDAYYEGILEPSDIGDSLEKFHLRIQELFEHSITDTLRGIMNA